MTAMHRRSPFLRSPCANTRSFWCHDGSWSPTVFHQEKFCTCCMRLIDELVPKQLDHNLALPGSEHQKLWGDPQALIREFCSACRGYPCSLALSFLGRFVGKCRTCRFKAHGSAGISTVLSSPGAERSGQEDILYRLQKMKVSQDQGLAGPAHKHRNSFVSARCQEKALDLRRPNPKR